MFLAVIMIKCYVEITRKRSASKLSVQSDHPEFYDEYEKLKEKAFSLSDKVEENVFFKQQFTLEYNRFF